MRYLLLLALPILLAACESNPRHWAPGPDQTVEVMNRTWTVTKITEEPVYYRAIRDQTEYFMFGPPARTKSAQAIRAIETATGCRVDHSTFYRDVSDYFYTQVVCK